MNDETGAFTITHREYLTDIYAPGTAGSGVATAFSSQSFALNPALQSSFTFLSQVAQNFDEYQFHQLLFHYRSTTTDIGNSTTGQCGTIIMACNYNAAAPAFVDKQSMMEYAHAVSCKVTESLSFGVECDPAKSAAGATSLYTRSNPVVTGQDLKTYDIGLFQVAVANCPAAYNGLPIGELWVEYKCSFRKPKLFASRGLDCDADEFYISSSLGATMSGANWWGAVADDQFALKGQQNNIGCVVVSTAPGASLTFPANYTGNVRVTVVLTGTTISAMSPWLPAAGSNIVLVKDVYYTGTVPQNELRAFNGTYAISVQDFWVGASFNGVNNTLTMAGATAATITKAWISVNQYNTLSDQAMTTTSVQPRFVYKQSGVLVNPV
jgi:hypothetical protein